jgi:alkanesulfonate monooxygenase SsuD/methylene tetrahydromethanopterin reductase-like flavin-dependent oxidoreductase (luciferase family)
VAQYADACNFLTVTQPMGVLSAQDVRRKLAVLKAHCEEAGRPYGAVLRTHLTGWLVLAEDEASLRAKLARFFPGGVEARYGGEWAGFVLAGTPAAVLPHYQQLVDSGIQYLVVQTLDARDQETIRLFAQAVMPQIRYTAT